MKALSPQMKSLARKFYRAIGTPLSSGLLAALEADDWDTIATCKVSPGTYISSQDYFLDASAASFLKKCAALPTTIDKKASAVLNWLAGERDCYKTNERLSPYLEGCSHPDWNEDVAAHIEQLRKKVSSILGRAPAMEHLKPRFGPGATFSDKSSRSTVAHKMQSNASITPSATWFLLDWVGTAWGREALAAGVCPFPVRGNRFTTAPKDATKDRPIAAEPSVNIYYQLALGREIRLRLKRIGIDLNVASEIHRQVACEASISGSYATLDMSNASDTVAYNLVKLLLPPDWFTLLAELRSSHTLMPDVDSALVLGRKPSVPGDHWVKLEKFSSMGNGFTFELETLIFYVIADYATSVALSGHADKQVTRAYGDDILCDNRGVDNVIPLLRFCGFSLNESKSFHSKAFRESCGGDFWGGRPVRPYYLKNQLSEPQQLIAFANGVRRLAYDLYGGLGPMAGLWFSIQDQIPSKIRRCRGPSGLGDIVIHDEESTWSWCGKRTIPQIQAYTPVKHREVPLDQFELGVVFACGLYGHIVSKGFLTPRDSVAGYGVRKVSPYWCDWLPEQRIQGDTTPLTAYAGPSGPRYDGSSYRVRVPAQI